MAKRSTGTRVTLCLSLSLLMLWLCLAMPFASAATYPYTTQSQENVNLRKSANENATLLARIQKGDTVIVLGESGRFFKVKYNGITGYAVKGYIDGTATAEQGPAPTAAVGAAASALTEYPYYTTVSGSVKLRVNPTEDATVLVVVPADAVIQALGSTGDYIQAKYNGKTGYLKSAYVNQLLAASTLATVAPSSGSNTTFVTVQLGSTGLVVRAVQEALTELGFYTGTVDSKYGSGTEKAMLAFQKKNKITQSGIADEASQKLLFDGTPLNSKGTRKSVKTLSPVIGTAAKQGKTGELVERIHQRLKELGYYSGEVTDTYTKDTTAAVKAFQKNHTLKQTGIADSEMQTLLFGASALAAYQSPTAAPTAAITAPPDTLRKGDEGDGVKAMQQRLQQLGFYTGNVDGKFGDGTQKALINFQVSAKLNEDGVCGAKTKEALFSASAPYVNSTLPPLTSTLPPVTEENVVIISAGSRGAAVLYLQKRLTELGYYVSRQDGICLSDDVDAIRAFQQRNGLKTDGKAGYETQSLLYSDTAQRAAATITASTTISTTLRYGSAGDDVVTLQTRLSELGYLNASADGKFGFATKSALVSFQRQNSLAADGVAGAKTLNVLFSDSVGKAQVTATGILKLGSAGTSVQELQSKLISMGYLSGAADGVFGKLTTTALAAFQKRNGLKADGIAGSKTLTTLNSSDAKSAAGAAATPKPSAPTLSLANVPKASSVRYAYWYDEVRAQAKLYPYATVYDFTTGISWQVHMFSLGAHADSEPLTAEDTARMNQAFGGKTTWTPKAVWVVLSNGRVYMASTHNTPHGVQHITDNNFAGHLCIHFPRTASQVASIGTYATSHQKEIDLGWSGTLQRAALGY